MRMPLSLRDLSHSLPSLPLSTGCRGERLLGPLPSTGRSPDAPAAASERDLWLPPNALEQAPSAGHVHPRPHPTTSDGAGQRRRTSWTCWVRGPDAPADRQSVTWDGCGRVCVSAFIQVVLPTTVDMACVPCVGACVCECTWVQTRLHRARTAADT